MSHLIKHSGKYSGKYFWVMAFCLIFTACNEENPNLTTPIKIDKVYLENAQSSVTDRPVEFARLGQVIRLEGSGFSGLQQLLVNGEDVYFNPVFIGNTSMVFQISRDIPTKDLPEDIKNTICLIKGSIKYVYNFEIRAAAPSITNVSHTMAQAGEQIVLTGSGLYGVSDVIFPGGIHAAEFTSDEEEGKWCNVIVPADITESGSITFIGVDGGAYTAPNFNYKEGVVHDFDDIQNYSWGSNIDNVAVTASVPTSGNLPKSQGGYQIFNASGNTAANADQRFWLNSTAIFSTITNHIPGSTLAADCGIQFDIYIEGTWNSGIIRFVMADGSGASRYCMIYQPVYVNGTYNPEALANPGCWFTVTLPFSLSSDYEGKTLDDVVASMSAASYKQSGPWFENSGITDVFDPVVATQKIYFDNIRFVPLAVPEYSDFPDDEE
ncbi:MAG: glycan-binding surface protein [Bacteroidales bacterium]|jgi:hypothetical protein|nr:glycan-binding surface protein [Bacteroidales bacterium]